MAGFDRKPNLMTEHFFEIIDGLSSARVLVRHDAAVGGHWALVPAGDRFTSSMRGCPYSTVLRSIAKGLRSSHRALNSAIVYVQHRTRPHGHQFLCLLLHCDGLNVYYRAKPLGRKIRERQIFGILSKPATHVREVSYVCTRSRKVPMAGGGCVPPAA